MKIAVIIQARMGSTRLPGKVMKKIKDETVLSHVIERVRKAKTIDEIIIATTTLEQDQSIVNQGLQSNIKVFRGSETDVLSRYYLAAKENNVDIIIRITSDCPLIDPNIIDELVEHYQNSNYDIVTNAGNDISNRTYPRGLDTEVFSFEMLEAGYENATKDYQREHVTPYIYENAKSIYYYKNAHNFSEYRWTLDTEEDFQLIKEIYDVLYHGEHSFYMEDIIRLFKERPELYEINKNIEQKKIN